MPTLCIQPQPDGTVLVGPSDYELDQSKAETFENLDTALQAVGEVLGAEGEAPTEEQETPEEQSMDPSESMEMQGDMSPMQAGFMKAKKGR